jgi:hypothetical protein
VLFMYVFLYYYIVLSWCIYIYPLKYTLRCPLIVDNDNTQQSHSLQSTLVFTVRFTQKAALIFKMVVSCITTQLIAYNAVDGP